MYLGPFGTFQYAQNKARNSGLSIQGTLCPVTWFFFCGIFKIFRARPHLKEKPEAEIQGSVMPCQLTLWGAIGHFLLVNFPETIMNFMSCKSDYYNLHNLGN